MSTTDPSFWNRVRRAQAKLIDRYLAHPDVTLIDIGYGPEELGFEPGTVVVRLHVRQRWFEASKESRISFPSRIDDLPVIVIPGEYGLESPGANPAG